MDGEDRQWPTMLEEEACRRRCLHAAPKRQHLGNRADSCGGVCASRAHLSVTRVSGLGRQPLAHLLVWAVSPHAPSKCVFQNTNLRNLICIPKCPRISYVFSFFGSNLIPRL